MKQNSFWSKIGSFLLGKGFYMVLLLCVMAIGGSGYYLYNLAHTTLNAGQQPVTGSAQVQVETVKPEPQSQVEKPLPAQKPVTPVQPPKQETAKPESPAAETATTEETVTQQEPAQPAEQTQQEPAAETAAPAEVEEETSPVFANPVEGEAVAVFSNTELTYNAALGDWRTHNGVDLSAELGDPVCAAKDGEVLTVSDDVLLGTTVKVNHGDGLMTVYGNLSSELEVEQGDRVTAGQVIGTVGNTAQGEACEGAWLHFAVEQDGAAVDPMAYLSENG